MNFQTKEGYRLNVAMIIFNEDKKVFDPNKVYKGQENPTKL